ncbi:C-C chemokine receptor type 4-like [Scyliorhinus canicula]|uniref:C-C chemokine receptor type 4-like n=1 Tax=Scyliorhinus canicula TaxID=7830 RepID=UPI0018F43197|nr:C-C chemokine receptor type 4-like [Scyliorhinus canicula]
MAFTMNTSEAQNTTGSEYDYYDDDEDLYSPCNMGSAKVFSGSFLPVLYSLVFAFGLPGNILVMWILLKLKRLKNMTNIYLFNLALCDLLFVITLPFWAYFAANEWIWGDAFCKIITVAYMLGYYGGIMFLILISIDRYLAIVHAVFSVRARTARNGIISSAVMWCVALFSSLPTMIFNRTDSIEGRKVCYTLFPAEHASSWKLFTLFKDNVLGFFVPSAVMVFCYARIIQTLLKNKSYKKHRAIKVIFTVVVVFFVFWTPHNVVTFLEFLKELNVLSGCQLSLHLNIARQVTESITFVHCCLNPVIYAFMGERFRSQLRKLFHSCLPPLLRHNTRDKLHFSSRDCATSFRSQTSVDHESSTFM